MRPVVTPLARTAGRRARSVAVAATAIAGSAGVGALSGSFARVLRDARRTGDHPAEVIVVFGARALPSGPSSELRARLDHAATLLGDRRAPLVLCCGGISGEVDEGEVMRKYLIEAGVDAGSVEVAPGATTRAAVASVRFAGFSSMVAVTSPYHLHRVMAEARRAGVVCVGCAPPTTPESADPAIRWVRIATEVMASVWYALPAQLTSRIDTGPTTFRHRIPRAVVNQIRRR